MMLIEDFIPNDVLLLSKAFVSGRRSNFYYPTCVFLNKALLLAYLC